MLLDKQGRCSQQLRSSSGLQMNASAASHLAAAAVAAAAANASSSSSASAAAPPSIGVGNLAQVSHTIGQNMTDISHIGDCVGDVGRASAGANGCVDVVGSCSSSDGRPVVAQKVLPRALPSCINFTFTEYNQHAPTQVPKIVTTNHSSPNAAAAAPTGASDNGGITACALAGLQPPRLKERGASLPPSALPRPPRSLKPPRKIDYDRLSGGDTITTIDSLKTRPHTPPKLPPSPTTSASSTVSTSASTQSSQQSVGHLPPPSKYAGEPQQHRTALKRADFAARRTDSGDKAVAASFTLKRAKDYGTMKSNTSAVAEFSKPEYTSTRNYQRLEESPKPVRGHSVGPASSPHQNHNQQQQQQQQQRSLLPSVRKYSSAAPPSPTAPVHQSMIPPAPPSKSSRDSLNSSGSNNSTHSASHHHHHHLHQQPQHPQQQHRFNAPQYAAPPHYNHHHQLTTAAAAQLQHARTPPKFTNNTAGGINGAHNNSTMSGAEKTLIAARHQNSQRQLHLQQQQHQQQATNSLKQPSPSPSAASTVSHTAVDALPPKPMADATNSSNHGNHGSGCAGKVVTRRSGSLARGENRYRIQF